MALRTTGSQPTTNALSFSCSCYYQRPITYVHINGIHARCSVCIRGDPRYVPIAQFPLTPQIIATIRQERDERYADLSKKRQSKVTRLAQIVNIAERVRTAETAVAAQSSVSNAKYDERFVINLIRRINLFLGDWAIVASGVSNSWREAFVVYTQDWTCSFEMFKRIMLRSSLASAHLPLRNYDSFHEALFEKLVANTASEGTYETGSLKDEEIVLLQQRSPAFISRIVKRCDVCRRLSTIRGKLRALGLSDVFEQRFGHWKMYIKLMPAECAGIIEIFA